MPPETELIKQQMGQTRASLTEKMESLENKVLGTVSGTTDAVSHTVQLVGSTVRDTSTDIRSVVQDAVGSMRDALDVSRQAQQHPWVLLGGSVFVGYVGGLMLDNLENGRLPSLPSLPASPEQLLPQGSEMRERIEAEPPARRSGFSFFRALMDTFAPEVDKLKRAAIGAAMGAMRDKLRESVPPHMQENITEMMDRVARKLGGEPAPPGAMFGREEAESEDRNGSERIRSTGIG